MISYIIRKFPGCKEWETNEQPRIHTQNSIMKFLHPQASLLESTTINILVRNKQDILLQSSHFFQVPICSVGGFPAPAFAYLPPHSVHKKDCLNSWHSFSVLPFRSSWTSRAKISANFNHVLHTVPASGVKKNFKRPTEISA